METSPYFWQQQNSFMSMLTVDKNEQQSNNNRK